MSALPARRLSLFLGLILFSLFNAGPVFAKCLVKPEGKKSACARIQCGESVRDGKCRDTIHKCKKKCASGKMCTNELCVSSVNTGDNGQACDADSKCKSGICFGLGLRFDGLVCAIENASSGKVKCVCSGKKSKGSSCYRAGDCQSNVCTGNPGAGADFGTAYCQ